MSAPFMQLYVGDYLADTLDLTTEEHGAYLLLLMTLWRHEARLPNDPSKLARIARVSPRRWHLVWGSIGKFFFIDGDQIGNQRLDREHEKAASISEKRSASGAKGGRAKALKDNDQPMANATVLPQHSQISDIREKEEANASSKKRGSRITDAWRLPRAWGVWAVEYGMCEAAVRAEADRFRDYWLAKPGAGGVKLDWQATWRNWVRKALADAPKRASRDAEEARLEAWGIGDAKPFRPEPGVGDRPAEATAGAADDGDPPFLSGPVMRALRVVA